MSGTHRCLYGPERSVAELSPFILNGIDDFAQRPDMLDRSVCLQLRPIMAAHRRCEEDFWADFMRDYPRILGGVLDTIASAMRILATIKLQELERMADFTRWGEAAAQAAGWPPGTFVSAYRGNRRAVSVVTLEESPLAQAIISLIKYPGAFKGTMTQLLEALAGYTGSCRLTVPGWPRTPNMAAAELRRIAPLLRTEGISVIFERGAHGTRLISIASVNQGGMPGERRA
jgi:putative DNA primase/helicase